MNFSQEYLKKKAYIDALLEDEMNLICSPSEVLSQSVRYSISTGGKRLRAILAAEFFSIFGGKTYKSAECLFKAIELLHLYTLVHDDLPCMDNDDYRRGLAANHKIFGDGMALLCGDALLNRAYELLFLGASQSVDKAAFINAGRVFSRYAGFSGVVGGQALEFEQNREINIENLLLIYKHKTCDLICASSVAGAILAKADDNAIKIIEEFSYHFGIAFQIRDDLLDITEKGCVEKNSLVDLIGEKKANIMLNENIAAAHDDLLLLGIKSGFLSELTDFAGKREG